MSKTPALLTSLNPTEHLLTRRGRSNAREAASTVPVRMGWLHASGLVLHAN